MTNKKKNQDVSLEGLDEASLIAGIGSKSAISAPKPIIQPTEHRPEETVITKNENEGKENSEKKAEINNVNSLDTNDKINNLDFEKPSSPNDNINESAEKISTPNKASRKRSLKPKEFNEFFQFKEIIKDRTATYVSSANHERLSKIVALVGSKHGATITSYLNNIINEHMDLYADEKIIGELTIKDIINPQTE